MAFNPDEARDRIGRWTDGGSVGQDKIADALTVKQLDATFKRVPTLTTAERDALTNYQNDGYELVNRSLRDPERLMGFWSKEYGADGARQMMDDQRASNDALSAAIGRMPPLESPVSVWRSSPNLAWLGNEHFADPENIQSSIVGTTIEDKGFVSTTASQAQAKTWSGIASNEGDATMFEIRLPKGTRGAWMRKVDPDSQKVYIVKQEMLLNRGAKFKITGARRVANARGYENLYVTMEYQP